MLKLHLYRFLGIFIPYYKRFMNRNMMWWLNDTISKHLTKYEDIKEFTIESAVLVSKSKYHARLKSKIQYQKIDFNVNIEIFDDINIMLNLSEEYEFNFKEFHELSKFFEHYDAINRDELKSLFKTFR